LGIGTGIYFIKKVDATTVKLAKSRSNIFTDNFISVNDTVSNNKFEFADFTYSNLETRLLEPQKIIRKISEPQNDSNIYETTFGTVGILVNGVEIISYKSKDVIYYGPIEEIIPINKGKNYDIINPPVLTVSDSIGNGASAYCSINGNLQRIEILDQGFDYLEDPVITISGGNGIDASAKANLINFEHSVIFNPTAFGGLVNLTNNTIGFTTYHKFRNIEEVIYNPQGQTAVGGLSTNSTYFVSTENALTVKLYNSFEDANIGINTISLTSYGVGSHIFKSIVNKKKIGSITVKNSGKNYQNKETTTSSSGINTATDTIQIKNHGYKSGEIVTYTSTGSLIGGLGESSYYVTIVDNDNFKLSNIGNGNVGIDTGIKDFYYRTNQYVNLLSTGSGTHIFNYPQISVEVNGIIGVSTFAGQDFAAKVQPIFRGEISSVFVESGGSNYGSEEIINFNRQPEFLLSQGSGAQVTPIISNGKIVEILVNSSGTQYNCIPDLEITGSGSGAILTPIISNGLLLEVKVISGGGGYSSDTQITVKAPGSESNFESVIKSWKINLVERAFNTNEITNDDGFVFKSPINSFGIQYTHAYAPRKLRSSLLASSIISGEIFYNPDLQVMNGVEINNGSTAHSPIIGWAYDGNPIYGPYGYTTPNGGLVRPMVSGYTLKLQNNRPSISLYPEGFFVEDYEYIKNGDLDENNGRFCLTPDYPNGTYAYFSTISNTSVETSGSFRNYFKPIFPYIIGNYFKSKPTPYSITNSRSGYDYLFNPNSVKKQVSIVKSINSGNVDSVGIITGGIGYKIGDKVVFDTVNTGGNNLSASVSLIKGKSVSSIGYTSSTLENVEFYPTNLLGSFIGFSTIPHNFLNNDLVTITTEYEYEKFNNIKVTTNSLTLSASIGSTSYTGLVTYFSVSGNLSYPNIKENDIYKIGIEEVKILNIDPKSSRIRVLRNQNNVSGITSYSAGIALTEKTRKFGINFGISTSYQFNVNSELYFNPREAVGLGSTSGVGIVSTLYFANPGVGITQIAIPTQTIYLPNHNLNNGDSLIYNSNGGTTLSISTNGIFTYSLGNNSVVYASKISEDLIGISTVKVGVGSTGGFVGFGTIGGGLLYFRNVGTGDTHSFKTNYSNILSGQVRKNVVTVSTASSHQLSNNDNVVINITPNVTSTITVKYDDFNRRLVINPKSFTASDVDILNNIITLSNHGYKTGQKIIHTSTSPSGGLINNSIYYVIAINSNKIKLSNTYYGATKLNSNIVSITSASLGTISPVNPPIKAIENCLIKFDLSDASLAFIKNGISYPAFELNFYTDSKLKNKFYSSKYSTSFEVIKEGNAGIDAIAYTTLKLNNNLPKVLYYNLDPINLDNNTNIKKEIVSDLEVVGNNQINLTGSGYNGTYSAIANSSDEFKFNILNDPETSSYSSLDGNLEYYTDSSSVTGSIEKIKINYSEKNYNVPPTIVSVSSNSGEDALLTLSGQTIGSVQKTQIEDIGFEYSCDLSVRPLAKLPTILKIDPQSKLKLIGISSVGRNYFIAPDLILIDGLTKNVVTDVKLKYTLGDQKVTIVENTSGISNLTPTIIPINNCNGIGISTISYISSSKDVVVGLAASFSNPEDFPFSVGSKVLIENISVGVGSTGKGFNSEKYSYQLFALTSVTPNIGGIGATVAYNLSEYLSNGEQPGTFDSTNSAGKIIPENDFPIFNVELQKNVLYNGESISPDGIIQHWDEKNGYLKVISNYDFYVGETIVTNSSNSRIIVSEIIGKSDAVYNVNDSSIVKKGWNKETGFLNNNLQRMHDNNYYQSFSYSLKSKVPFDTWNTPVDTLNHTSGFKKFSDLIIESIPYTYSGLSTSQNNIDVAAISNLDSTINLNCFNDFDLVTENNLNISGTIKSNKIRFNSKTLQDYIESVGNRVITIDDLSPLFNSNPRATPFSIADNFKLNTCRYRKYFTFVSDRFYIDQKQIMFVSLINDGEFGYLNQYGRVETGNELGSFDFNISGDEGNLLFYPNEFKINNYDLSLISYDIKDSISGVGSTSLGNCVDIRSSTVTLPTGTTSATTIVGIASTYRSSKVLVQIGATDGTYYQVNELTLLHNGSNVELLDYGPLTTDTLSVLGSVGLGTYIPYISGSNVNIDFKPDQSLTVDYNINTLRISIGNTSATGIGTFDLLDSKFNSTVTSIASTSSPTANLVASFSDSYDGAYYIANVENTTNNTYQVSELMSITDGTTASLAEFGIIYTNSSLGEFTVQMSGTITNLYFTPNENITTQVRIFQNSIGHIHDTLLNNNLDLNNAKISATYNTYSGTEVDIKKSFELTHNQIPIFEKYFEGTNSSIVNISSNTITIPNHYFVTGEEIAYSYLGTTSTNAIGIGTTSIVGVGTTNKLPSKLYIIKLNDLNVRVAASASEALLPIPNPLTLTSVGIGTLHKFTAKNQNSKLLVSVDNVIQSPIVSTAITTTLSGNVSLLDTQIIFSGITSFFAGDTVIIDNEVMKIDSVGVAGTNYISVRRPWFGTGIATHSSGTLVTKIQGNYNVIGNTINFETPPFGKIPFPNPNDRGDEQDYVGLETSSRFNGRVFTKSATPSTELEAYYNNYIFDDVSTDFDGYTSKFTLKNRGSNITGISTSNSIILINSIFQGPAKSVDSQVISENCILKEYAGITSVFFTGSQASTTYDVNTASIPRGGIIVSVASTEGSAYQPLVSAGGTAIVSIAGTISSISIGNSGSGYRVGIQTYVNVGVATSSTGTPNIKFIGTATISNGNIVSVAITSPGVGYTSSNPPIVIFDAPLSYTNIPLVYDSTSTGIGTGAKVDIVVGQGSSVISFEIKNNGYGYNKSDVLTVDIGGTTGIPTDTSSTFKKFKLTIDNIFDDRFSGWTIGDLQIIDPLDSLFDNQTNLFPIKINNELTSIRSRAGSNIDVQDCLLVFINDILQVPGEGYSFKGGSYIEFQEPPKAGDTSKILFYRGNGDIDTANIDILETIKVGDNVTIYDEYNISTENERLTTAINSTDEIGTNVYSGPGISNNSTLLRPLVWCKQNEDKIIDGQYVSKSRTSYEPLVQPVTNIIQNIGVTSSIIFVESVKTFFDNQMEYTSSSNAPKTIIVTSQDTLVAASATAVVSVAGTISSIVITDGGIGYISTPSVTIQSPVGLGSTLRASATSSITSGIVTTITVTSSGTGYTSTNPPVVLVESPSPISEVITKVNYEGDFGIITGIKTTSVGVASTGIVFDLHIPKNSFLRNSSIVGSAITVSGIQTGYYFVVHNSNVGRGVTSLRQSGTVVGLGSTFIDNIYEVAAVSIGQTSVPGIGVTYVAKVTVSLSSYNGLTGLGFSGFYGEYSWGRITNLIRTDPNSFSVYNNGISGLSTSPVVQRYNPLKYQNYFT